MGRLWAQAGHQVTVLTGFPNHPTGRVHPEYRSRLWRLLMRDDREGVRVYRTWLVPLPNRKSWERMLNYASFCLSAVLRGIFLPRPDVVIASSPQLLVGLAGLIIAKWKCIPFVFEVRDLWPESLEAVGASGNGSPLLWMLRKLAGRLYRSAAQIVVVTQPFKEHLECKWGISAEKISVVVNGVDQHLFSPRAQDAETIQEFGLTDRFVVGYIGTIGNAHGIETLVDVASILKESNPEIYFLVVGEGAEKSKLQSIVAGKQLANIGIFTGQPRSRIPAIVAASHLCLVLLRNSELFKTVVPTKMLEFMSCGRPLVAAVNGEAAHLIQKAGAGICVEPANAPAIAQAIQSLRHDPVLRSQLGKRGRNFIVNNLTREATAQQYLSILANIGQQVQEKSVAQLDSNGRASEITVRTRGVGD